jgi:hypothetical protein
VFLGLVSQRPAELDATIISQCSTLFAMRMTNDRDQAILKSAVSDAAANLLDFLPSLGTGEVFAFGEGVALPTRVKLKKLSVDMLPKSDIISGARADFIAGVNDEFFAAVLKRWRGASTTQPIGSDETKLAEQAAAAPPLQPVPVTEAERPSLLRRSPGERLDLSRAFQPPASPRRLTET